MAYDPSLQDHQAWIGYLQPEGLVVSPAVLADQQLSIDRGTLSLHHQDFLALLQPGLNANGDEELLLPEFPTFAQTFLGWKLDKLLSVPQIPRSFEVPLENDESLRPDFVLLRKAPNTEPTGWQPALPGCSPDSSPTPSNPQETEKSKTGFGDESPSGVRGGSPELVPSDALLLIQSLPPATDLDATGSSKEQGWQASPARKFERLLRETQVPIGILYNQRQLRLVYAPRGETVGSLSFPVSAMTGIPGRPIVAALKLLLEDYRLFAAPSPTRLEALLQKSREYQSKVSNELATQVLDALYEFLRGFQQADTAAQGKLLEKALRDDPAQIYGGLLNSLMRMVFLLYAEDRGLTPDSSLYTRFYSVHGLFERLRADNERYPDTMDHRYGAWAQLLALFRAVHAGCRHPGLSMPPRSGYLFDPDRFPFLEGRASPLDELPAQLPLVPDGVLFRILAKLMLLGGERLSYRSLDVEQIGSVYETMMGFRLEVAPGLSLALKVKGKSGAPVAVNLEELLALDGAKRLEALKKLDIEFTPKAALPLKEATSMDALIAACKSKLASNATPAPVPKGGLLLQPSDERRRSGSHYTPRSLTEPIVRKALAPVLAALGPNPRPDQILDLKICDPAVGSGAFLVEACRQLADALVAAWQSHKTSLLLPPDEDEILYARRLVAQACLYGVDRNPMAADLAKLSLWLVTLAKDHPFTFLDHSIRAGDSLVGLSKRQIEDFHWLPSPERRLGQQFLLERIETAAKRRIEILGGGDLLLPHFKAEKLKDADRALSLVRDAADAVIAAFFAAAKPKERQTKRDEALDGFSSYLGQGKPEDRPTALIDSLAQGPHPVKAFHWEIEFPEVFSGSKPGFHAIVGNPPYAGKNTVAGGNRAHYPEWLQTLHEETHGNADLAAHFFRRAFSLLRVNGCVGFVTTNTIAQGDTRDSGLKWILSHGGTITHATRRLKWPGLAAVVVSIIHIIKGKSLTYKSLDNEPVERISAFLFPGNMDDSPKQLKENRSKSFQGSIFLGTGFTFDDNDNKGIASKLSVMKSIIANDPRNAERIFPLIGYSEVASNPRHYHDRYIIDFGEMSEDEANRWPDLLNIVAEKVRPEREKKTASSIDKRRAELWWQYGSPAKDLYNEIKCKKRVLVAGAQASAHFAFAFLPLGLIYSSNLSVMALDQNSDLCIIQSRVHEIWTRMFMSTLEDRLCYTPTTCFETFPFPENLLDQPELYTDLEEAGREYYEYRAALMIRNNEGLTKTYNRFHDEGNRDPDIAELRRLHAVMDAAVLRAYGWDDLATRAADPATCQFIPDFTETDEDTGLEIPKNIRYRWPDELRDEVLARLLALNQQRSFQETLSGPGALPKKATKKPSAKPAKEPKAPKEPPKPKPKTNSKKQRGDDENQPMLGLG